MRHLPFGKSWFITGLCVSRFAIRINKSKLSGCQADCLPDTHHYTQSFGKVNSFLGLGLCIMTLWCRFSLIFKELFCAAFTSRWCVCVFIVIQPTLCFVIISNLIPFQLSTALCFYKLSESRFFKKHLSRHKHRLFTVAEQIFTVYYLYIIII